MNTPYDDPHGELLSRALKAEAETIRPAGDGLSRIRDRVERRRGRVRWLMPVASLGTAAALTGGAFGAYNAFSGDDQALRTGRLAHTGPAQHSSAAPSATQPTTPSASTTAPSTARSTDPATAVATRKGEAAAPATPVWPFHSAAYVAMWQQAYADSGSQPWHLDAGATATAFVDSLNLPAQDLGVATTTPVSNGTVDVRVTTASTADGTPRVFAIVRLTRWGAGANAPWEVIGVTAPGLSIDSPAAAAAVASPVTVRYTLDGGVEEDVYTSAWDSGGRLASGHATVGGGAQQATLSFGRARAAAGYVVVADVQSASGTATLTRLAVTPVRLGTSATPTNPQGKQYPPYFVAVQDQRVGLFYSKLGGFGRWLTDPQPGGGVSSPQLTADDRWVYFLRGGGTGVQNLMRVSINGGAEEQVVTDADTITSFAVGGDHGQFLAYVVTKDGSQALVWRNADTGQGGTYQQHSVPPEFGRLAWSADGQHLTAQVRTGTAWELRTYAVATMSSLDSELTTRPDRSAPSYDAHGNLYYVQAIDATHWELLQYDGSRERHVSTITLPEQASPEQAAVDITPDAYAAMVSTPNGHVYRVNDGVAHLLPTDATEASW